MRTIRRTKTRKPPYSREVDLAAEVVNWLRSSGWDVYQEVAKIDIVAKKDGIIWAIECKLSLNLSVLSQAHGAKECSHRTSVAVPAKFYDSQFTFGCRVAQQFDIGVIMASPTKVQEKVIAPARFSCTDYLAPWFNEKARDFCPAGSPGGAAWTPFKQTMETLHTYIVENGPSQVKAAIASISHHYASNASASSALSKLLGRNVDPRLRLDFDAKSKRHFIVLTGA